MIRTPTPSARAANNPTRLVTAVNQSTSERVTAPDRQRPVRVVDQVDFVVEVIVENQRRGGQGKATHKPQDPNLPGWQPACSQHLAGGDADRGRQGQFGAEQPDQPVDFLGWHGQIIVPIPAKNRYN